MPSENFLVCGGSGGIGAAVCARLAKRYRPVVCFCNSQKAAEDVALQCGGWALQLDLTDSASIAAAVESLSAEESGLAGVVLAASPPPALGPFSRINEADMMAQWQVNVLGPQQLLAGLILNVFRKQKSGSIIGVLSQAMGQDGSPAMASMGAYVIGKYGLAGVLALVAAEYSWLQVSSVRPGFTETNMLQAFDERFLDQLRQQKPFQTPDEVAAEIITVMDGA